MIANSPNKFQANMVDNQIKPFSVNNKRILQAFEHINRHDFVPTKLQGRTYVSEDIEVAKGRYLMEPAVHARLVQSAYENLNEKDDFTVADIAGTLGYNACLWAYLGAHVTAFDNKEYQESDHERLDVFSGQIEFVDCELPDISKTNNAYDVIFINGAVSDIPSYYLKALKPEGAIYCIYRPQANVSYAARIIRSGQSDKKIVERLFDAYTPLLKDYQSTQGFVF